MIGLLPLTEAVFGIVAVAAILLIVYLITHHGRRKRLTPPVFESLGYPVKETRNPQDWQGTDESVRVSKPPTKMCPHCGAQIPRESRSCMKCGLPALNLGAD